jgi:hypothetical protein
MFRRTNEHPSRCIGSCDVGKITCLLRDSENTPLRGGNRRLFPDPGGCANANLRRTSWPCICHLAPRMGGRLLGPPRILMICYGSATRASSESTNTVNLSVPQQQSLTSLKLHFAPETESSCVVSSNIVHYKSWQ